MEHTFHSTIKVVTFLSLPKLEILICKMNSTVFFTSLWHAQLTIFKSASQLKCVTTLSEVQKLAICEFTDAVHQSNPPQKNSCIALHKATKRNDHKNKEQKSRKTCIFFTLSPGLLSVVSSNKTSNGLQF